MSLRACAVTNRNQRGITGAPGGLQPAESLLYSGQVNVFWLSLLVACLGSSSIHPFAHAHEPTGTSECSREL
ncbi:hypothetical protein BaRGS_00037381, partial [Batillaria attramentaria]